MGILWQQRYVLLQVHKYVQIYMDISWLCKSPLGLYLQALDVPKVIRKAKLSHLNSSARFQVINLCGWIVLQIFLHENYNTNLTDFSYSKIGQPFAASECRISHKIYRLLHHKFGNAFSGCCNDQCYHLSFSSHAISDGANKSRLGSSLIWYLWVVYFCIIYFDNIDVQ